MRGEDTSMILSMTETDYENWRDDLRCGGRQRGEGLEVQS